MQRISAIFCNRRVHGYSSGLGSLKVIEIEGVAESWGLASVNSDGTSKYCRVGQFTESFIETNFGLYCASDSRILRVTRSLNFRSVLLEFGRSKL
jgi:hypothetical protein